MKMNAGLLLLAGLTLMGCDKTDRSFSLLSDSQSFQQNGATVVQKQIDILWVVDNSGSMSPMQTNLVNNFNSFIQAFVTKGYDFHMAIATSDAYLDGSFFNNNPAYSVFRDGTGSTHTGFPIMDANTPNITSVFTTNATQGAAGSGDERVFSSFKSALLNPANSSFRRPGAFLAVIILSDEDDFSDGTRVEGSWVYGGIADHSYTNPTLESVDSYVSFLDTLTNSTSPTSRNYNVSAVTVMDTACLDAHKTQAPSTIIGQRYMDLANKTNGVLADLCSPSYATALDLIQKRIIELSTQFYLNRIPNEATIQIWVNGNLIPQDATNGWTYNSSSNAIVFHGTAVPPQNANIQVSFDPLTPKL